jgi:AsmA protein
MSRTLKIIAIVVAVLIVIVLVLPFVVPVNQFRPTIEQKASAALGRKAEVGNLSLSILSGSLGADNLSIADDPKFSSSPFLTAKSIKVGVELMPLILSKTLNVTDVSIDSPQVTLLRNPAGEWNYSTVGTSGARPPEKTEPAAQKPSNEPSQPSAAGKEFSVKRLELRNGRITVGSTNSQKRSIYDNVNVSAADVSLTSKFPVIITANLPGGGNMKLDGKVGPLDQSNATMTPVEAKLTVNNLNLATTGFLDPSGGLGGLLDLNATLTSQGGEAQTKGTARLSKALLVPGGSPASVPLDVDFSTKYDLAKNKGVLEPSTIKIGAATAHVSGTYEVPGDTTTVNLKIDAQNMPAKDLQAFLPALGVNVPKGASLQSGTLSANLNLTGPTNKLVTTGSVGMFNAKLAGFDLGSKLSTISALTGVKTGNDLEIEKMTTNLRMAPTGLNADNFNAVVPSLGTLAGNGAVDSKNNLDFKMVATLKNPLGGQGGAQGGAAQGGSPQSNSPAGALGGLLGSVAGGTAGQVAGGILTGCKATGGGPSIPFQIKGTTADPKFVPDVGGIAAGMLKQQLGCVGQAGSAGHAAAPGSQQQPGGNIQQQIDQLGGLFKKKKP